MKKTILLLVSLAAGGIWSGMAFATITSDTNSKVTFTIKNNTGFPCNFSSGDVSRSNLPSDGSVEFTGSNASRKGTSYQWSGTLVFACKKELSGRNPQGKEMTSVVLQGYSVDVSVACNGGDIGGGTCNSGLSFGLQNPTTGTPVPVQ